MAEKYLYGSLVAAGIWAFAGMFLVTGQYLCCLYWQQEYFL